MINTQFGFFQEVVSLNPLKSRKQDIGIFLDTLEARTNEVSPSNYTSQALLPRICDEIKLSSLNLSEFLLDYFLPQKPVVIKYDEESPSFHTDRFPFYGDINDWQRYIDSEKSQESHRSRVHVKFSPNKEYEGFEPLSWWQQEGDMSYIPDEVLVFC